MRCSTVILWLFTAVMFATLWASDVQPDAARVLSSNAAIKEEITRLLQADASVDLSVELKQILTRSLATDDTHHDDDDHPTPGHDAAESAGHETETKHSIFGSVSHIEPLIGAISLIITICAVLFLQFLFHLLHTFTADTSFTEMVVRIENELMIVGCSAFIFKIIANTTDFMDEKWLIALEFSEVLIPILSFCYCGIGVLLIVMALQQCDLWSKAYNLKLIEVIDIYLLREKTWFFHLSWKPMNKIIDEMEFRIFHNLFCEMFKIQRDAFAFDEYVHKVFEKFVMNVIEIRPIDWLIVAVVILLNLGRKELGWDYYHCHLHDTECDVNGTLKLFTLSGAGIFFVTCVFVYVSRNLQYKIMSKRGVNSWRHYSNYLQHMETASDRSAEKRRLNVEELKAAVLLAKLHQLKRAKTERTLADRVSDAQVEVRRFVHKINLGRLFFGTKLDAGHSPEAVEAIMKLALRGSSTKFDPLDPREFGESTANHDTFHEEGPASDHVNPYVHNVTDITQDPSALDGSTSELYRDMLKAERKKSMAVQQSGSDRRTSSATVASTVSGRNRAGHSNHPSAAVIPPMLQRDGHLGTDAHSSKQQLDENERMRQQLNRLGGAHQDDLDSDLRSLSRNGGGKSNLSSFENLHEIDLENGSVVAEPKGRSVPTVLSTKVKLAGPTEPRNFEDKSIGNSSDLSDDNDEGGGGAPPEEQESDNEISNMADHVMHFDDAGSVMSTLITSSNKLAGPSNVVHLPKLDTHGGSLSPTPLPALPPRKRSVFSKLTSALTLAAVEEEPANQRYSLSLRNLFPSGGSSKVGQSLADTNQLTEMPVDGSVKEKPVDGRGSGYSFFRQRLTDLGNKMFRRDRDKKMTASDAAMLEDLAADQLITSIEKDGSEVMDVFWLSQPEIYFECVQLIIVIIALYIALWLTNMLATAHTPFWICLSLLPGVLSTMNFMYIIKTASLLKAVYKVDFDSVLEVIEETESVRVLSEQLRAKVIERLQTQGDPHAELQRLFHEIDINGNNSLSRQEFELFMTTLGLSFSRRKWQQIYKEIDRNFDNCISFQEFYLFLYPDHDAALALEMKRLKVISKRVFKNSKLMARNNEGGRARTLSREESIERIKKQGHRKAVVVLNGDRLV